MKLDKHGWGTKEMIIMTGILFFLLLIITYYVAVYYHHLDYSHYYSLERQLVEAARMYSEETSNTKGKISADYLILHNYLDPLYDADGNICDGYVVFDDGSYDAYLNCKKYKTENY